MFALRGTPADHSSFEPFEPAEVLYEFDGPRTFTFSNRQGDLFLAHWCEECEDRQRFAVVPVTPGLAKMLKDGDISVREALDQPFQWIVEVGHEGDLKGAWSLRFSALPRGVLPEQGVMLYPNLQRLPRRCAKT
jgi:hypothetical protein